ncbi:MAG: YafY family protein [Anaerolineae bacterium]|nr:YafY family protein [Anaerolineae bacterium]
MRSARLLSILLLLQVHRRLTAGELAKRLEVSERTIYRDMEALSAAGVPVFAERGSSGGWSLLEEYRTHLTGLSETEVQPLFLTQPARLLADLGWDQPAEGALIKLLAALPAGVQRREAEFVRQRIHIDVTGWHGSTENAAFLPTLQEAIWHECKLKLTYQRGDETVVKRVVDPLGLVAKGSVWYLVAAVEGKARTYRVSRIQQVEIMNEPCLRPPDFDLAAYWDESKAHFVAALPRYEAILRAAPDIVPRLRYTGWFARLEHIEPPDEDGWCRVTIRFDTIDEASGYVLGFGPQIEIVEPPELRERVIELAQAIIAHYGLA